MDSDIRVQRTTLLLIMYCMLVRLSLYSTMLDHAKVDLKSKTLIIFSNAKNNFFVFVKKYKFSFPAIKTAKITLVEMKLQCTIIKS